MTPSFLPLFDPTTNKLLNGSFISICGFCKKAIEKKNECKRYYQTIQLQPVGYFQCPFGFTSRSFYFEGKMWIMTGVIGFPRFETDNERAMAKAYPEVKVARSDIDKIVKYLVSLESVRAAVIEKAAKVFPQAFHELRKLNGSIIQNAEKEIRESGGGGRLQTIHSAAELMRNNFDILEALSNTDAMRAVPLDATINVYDLLQKMRFVYQERAALRNIQINVSGVRAIIRGSLKSFPIVPAVLIENAIKYSRLASIIKSNISGGGKVMLLIVENQTDYPIDETMCFNKGSRFAGDSVEGGGFGLFLAREIVTAHGGKIRCEKNGSTVRMIVELPMEKVID
jgi:signal transduction histidine kinase